MGLLQHHDVQDYITKHNLVNFVETGTGPGWSFSYSLGLPFKKWLSTEVHKETYDTYCTQFINEEKGITLYNMESEDFIKGPVMELDKKPTLFFLDAHFPGTSTGGGYDTEKVNNIRIPLEKELRTLVSVRNCKKDVFIIDDLRIYIDGPFEGGNWTERNVLGGDGIDFVYDCFGDTHNIELSYKDQGYIIITPIK